MRDRIRNLAARGLVVLADSARKLQALQVRLLAGELKDGVEHLEPYGYTSCPLEGAEALALFLGGDRSHGVVVCVADRRYRLKGLKPGEVAIYTDEGDRIHLKRGRVVEIETATLRVKASAGVHFETPEITQTGRIVSQGDQVAAGVSQISHPHGGVQSGSGQTAAPIATE